MSRILVVDDDPDICALIDLKLTQSGHDVVVERNGVAGMAAATATMPDLIVLDWMLPGMSGLSLCVDIRTDPLTAHIPIVMISANAFEEDARWAYEAGVSDFLVKPFSPRELAHRVERQLAAQSQVRA